VVEGSRGAHPIGWTIGAVAAVFVTGCTGAPNAGIGETCSAHADCGATAQCFANICAPRCTVHAECGGGYTCRGEGVCERVMSQIGDICGRELDCGPRQSCQVDARDHDDDGLLGATCQRDYSGAVTGAMCQVDTDCRSGLCAVGLCTEVCATAMDCPGELACVDIPRLLAASSPMFRGCLPASGRLELDVPVSSPNATVRVAVPGNARSFALVSSVADRRHWVGVTRIEAPDGELLYRTPLTADDHAANRIRYAPSQQISTLLLPNAPDVPLKVGAYTIDVASLHFNGGPSTQVPSVRLIYRLDSADDAPTAGTLDLNLYFLDLADHPCSDAFPAGLDATRAPGSPELQSYLLALSDVLAGADIHIGDIGYHDIVDRPELDAIARHELGALLSESTATSSGHCSPNPPPRRASTSSSFAPFTRSGFRHCPVATPAHPASRALRPPVLPWPSTPCATATGTSSRARRHTPSRANSDCSATSNPTAARIPSPTAMPATTTFSTSASSPARW